MENAKKHLLTEIDIFKAMDKESLASLLSHTSVFLRAKGTMLCMAGEDAQHIYVVLSGWVKIYRETSGGAEAVLDVITTGAYFGEDTIFDGGLYLSNAEVIADAEIAAIPSALIKENVEKNQDFTKALLGHMSRKQKAKEHDVEHLSVQSAPQRIGCFLLRLAGGNSFKNVSFDLPYDKTLIAARLGMQPETFSRALTKLRNEAGVEITGTKVKIDEVERLSTYTCGACSSEFPCKDTKK